MNNVYKKYYKLKKYNEEGLKLLNRKKYLLYKLYLKEYEKEKREYVKVYKQKEGINMKKCGTYPSQRDN